MSVRLPLHLSLGASRHSATCHLWLCTTKMEKGIWHMGQKSPEDGPSAALSVCTVALVEDNFEGRLSASKLVCPLTSALQSPLSAVLTFLSGVFLTEEEVSLLEVFLRVHLLVTVVDGDSCIFFFFSSGLYSQISSSESSFCDIWGKRQRNVPNVTQRPPQNPRYYTSIDVC